MDNEFNIQDISIDVLMTEIFRRKIPLIKAVRDASEGVMGLLEAKRFVEKMAILHEADKKRLHEADKKRLAVSIAYQALDFDQRQKFLEIHSLTYR